MPVAPSDAMDVMPTRPRNLPGPSQIAAQPQRVPQNQAPRSPGSQARPRSFLQPWVVIVAILVAAALAGVVVAMSGPDVAVQRGK